MSSQKSNIKKYIDSEITPYVVSLKNLLTGAMDALYDQLQKEVNAINTRIDDSNKNIKSHIENKNNPHETTIDMLILDTQFREPLSSEGKDGDYFVELIK